MYKFTLPLFLSIIFFIASLTTLKDYGISWDEATHFKRGQAYVHYFLTGERHYNTLQEPRRSFFQNDELDGEYWLTVIGGHPPLNGIVASFANYIFFQELGIMGDIESYHLFNIFCGALLVFIVSSFALENFGKLSAIFAGVTMSTYPFFWAESHFNIKDPPETTFFAATIWTFYKSIQTQNYRWLLASSIFFGIALSIKFNILFLPFIMAIFLFVRYRENFSKPYQLISSIPLKFKITAAIYPFIASAILIAAWPTLQNDVIGNFLKVVRYYEENGAGVVYQPQSFFIFGFNSFPILWIIFTTPPVLVLLTLLGIFFIMRNIKSQNYLPLLLILWLTIPIVRVSMFHTTLYGGIRHILEFLPALILISTLAFSRIMNLLPSLWRYIFLTLVAIAVIYNIFVLIKIHPNQNVYFNSLIGGLHGASVINFPSWGTTYGNVYRQGINWINQNAEPNAKLTLLQGELQNAPNILVRPDIYYAKDAWSGYDRKGEYIMEMTFNDTAHAFASVWKYVNDFLIPVHEVTVDGTAILKIWKNDLGHTRPDMQRQIRELASSNIAQSVNSLTIDLGHELSLTRVFLQFKPYEDCVHPHYSFVETSLDSVKWNREDDPIPYLQNRYSSNTTNSSIDYLFGGTKAKYIRFVFENDQSCALSQPNVRIWYL